MSGDHAAVSTQEKNPRSTVVRTVVVAVLVLFPSLNIILGIVVEEMEPYSASVPGWVFGILNGGIVIVTVIVGICTRILAIPGVNVWLREHAAWLAPEGK